MKFYFVSFKIRYIYLIAILVILAFITASYYATSNIISAFAGDRELPIYYVDYPKKKVSITFDCAWGADDIPQILETLRKEDVKATFFVVGQWADKFPKAVKAIADGGHDVANHSLSHLRMGAISAGKITSEIDECGRKLSALSGKKVDLFRPPYGDYNNNVVNIAKGLGYYTIQWNVDSLDWKPGISKEDILNRIMRRVKPGSIILFHNDTPHTAKLLPIIITSLKNEGYGFLPVSQLIYKDNFIIDYDGKQKRK